MAHASAEPRRRLGTAEHRLAPRTERSCTCSTVAGILATGSALGRSAPSPGEILSHPVVTARLARVWVTVEHWSLPALVRVSGGLSIAILVVGASFAAALAADPAFAAGLSAHQLAGLRAAGVAALNADRLTFTR